MWGQPWAPLLDTERDPHTPGEQRALNWPGLAWLWTSSSLGRWNAPFDILRIWCWLYTAPKKCKSNLHRPLETFSFHNNKLTFYVQPFLCPPPKRKNWLTPPMGLNSGMLDGWETRVADSFNVLRAESLFFCLFCFVGLFFFFFFLINAEFLTDRQALGQKDVFTIQTDIHRKLLSLVCSEGSSLWRLSTAWQTVWMNASQCGRLGSRTGAGLEAGVYLTALLKGGVLEDINPGLSLSQFPWMESGLVKMLVGKAAVSQWKKQQLHPFLCKLLHTCLAMTAAPPQTSCYASLESPAQARRCGCQRWGPEMHRTRPHPTSSMGHSFFGRVWILLVVWNLFCWGPKSVLITFRNLIQKFRF